MKYMMILYATDQEKTDAFRYIKESAAFFKEYPETAKNTMTGNAIRHTWGIDLQDALNRIMTNDDINNVKNAYVLDQDGFVTHIKFSAEIICLVHTRKQHATVLDRVEE